MPLSLSLSLSLSVLKLSSSLKTLSGKLSQHHSLKLPHSPPSAWLILNIAATKARHHWPTSRPKPPISLRPTPPSALDPRRRSLQTHFSFVLSLSLSLFLHFSSDRVPHYPTHLKSKHSISLCTHHHCLWGLRYSFILFLIWFCRCIFVGWKILSNKSIRPLLVAAGPTSTGVLVGRWALKVFLFYFYFFIFNFFYR